MVKALLHSQSIDIIANICQDQFSTAIEPTVLNQSLGRDTPTESDISQCWGITKEDVNTDFLSPWGEQVQYQIVARSVP
uniref:Uncharacterized protein n=1 Tax=Romanomermis culicivorax TaxID=13658 RepID=A0A915LAR3_ROMCU